jgi:hypothetical protein
VRKLEDVQAEAKATPDQPHTAAENTPSSGSSPGVPVHPAGEAPPND